MDDGHIRSWELAFLLTIRATALGQILYHPSQLLARNLAFLTNGARENGRSRPFARDRTWQVLVADLVEPIESRAADTQTRSKRRYQT